MSRYIEYEDYRPQQEGQTLLRKADQILTNFAGQGLTLTVRQLYYQFVSHDYFPEDRRWRWTGEKWVRDPDGTKNALPNYDWLKGLISKGRMGGFIAWDHIEDRGRVHRTHLSYDDIAEHLRRASRYHALDWWDGQSNVAEVWVEKQALEGVIKRACDTRRTEFFACKGYVSASSMWEASQRILARYDGGQTTTIIHLGDHDPSGIDMTRDIEDRLRTFGCDEAVLEVNRIALTMEQITETGAPPNPAKMADSRAADYVEKFGASSWELDALDPDYLDRIIKAAIDEAIEEPELMEGQRELQREQRERMVEIADEEAAR